MHEQEVGLSRLRHLPELHEGYSSPEATRKAILPWFPRLKGHLVLQLVKGLITRHRQVAIHSHAEEMGVESAEGVRGGGRGKHHAAGHERC